MALMLNKTKTYRCALPGDTDIIESVLRVPTAIEENAFLKSRLEYSGKRGDVIDNGLESRCQLYDILVQDIKGKYEDNGELKDFSNASPIPQELLASFCESTGRVMSDKKGWQVKDLIPAGYKQNCILTLFENYQVDEDLKKK